MSGTRTPGGSAAPQGQWIDQWQALQAQRPAGAAGNNALPALNTFPAQQTTPPAPVAGFLAASANPAPGRLDTGGQMFDDSRNPLASYLAAAAQDPRIAGMRMNSAAARGQPEEIARYQQRQGDRTNQMAEKSIDRDIKHAMAGTRNDLQGWLGDNGPYAWWSPAYRAQQQQAVNALLTQFKLTPDVLQNLPSQAPGGLRQLANLYGQAQRPVSDPATVLPPGAYQAGTGIWAK